MDKEDMVLALDTFITLTTIGARGMAAAQEVGNMVRNAQMENRDLTKEERATLREKRAEAMNRWNEVKNL